MEPRSTLLLVGTMLLASCSIKENREECPCRLDVCFDGYCHEPLAVRFLDPGSFDTKAQYNNILFDPQTGRMELHDAGVPRRQLLAAACSGIRNNNFDGRNVIVPLGSEMDSVSSAVKFLDARAENESVTVTMNKQFCRLKVIFMDDYYRPEVRVSGRVSGLDVYGNTPIDGLFSFISDTVPFTVNIPRQLDDSLEMEVIDKEGRVAETLPLGAYIAATGYSWDAESLPDCTVLVDRARAVIEILVNDWDEGGRFTIKY